MKNEKFEGARSIQEAEAATTQIISFNPFYSIVNG